ncbi:MAG TPA: MM0924 family protein [Pyrinomonadaceae bacterium]|nr:MM0924 family protein [Pyrinomonadaceae bacterium]
MHELLSKMIGRRVDVVCSAAVRLRGEVVKVEGDVLHIKDDEQASYVAIDKIVVVWEERDTNEHRAGFVSGAIK